MLQEESEKKISGLYEKLQERLETIQGDLSSAEKNQKQLQEVVSFPPSYLVNIFYSLLSQTAIIREFLEEPKASKEDMDTVEGGEKN